MPAPRIAVAPPGVRPHLADAVRAGGGTVTAPAQAQGLVWADPGDAAALGELLDAHPQIGWVQLPWAGIEPFVRAGLVTPERTWTCGKGVYAEPVAEHALTLALAGVRQLHRYARVDRWTGQAGTSLVGQPVTVFGGGGIARELLRFLAPFGTPVTVVRRTPRPLDGAARVVGPEDGVGAARAALVVVLALPLTTETAGIVDGAFIDGLRQDAVLVNVARGEHVVTSDLVGRLAAGAIGMAALDVTAPEPLPDGHPLWHEPRCLITPHTANTEAMARPLIARRVADNVRRFAAAAPLLGLVDPAAGY